MAAGHLALLNFDAGASQALGKRAIGFGERVIRPPCHEDARPGAVAIEHVGGQAARVLVAIDDLG